VVGAGPTGLLLAAELQRRGVECRLIDANPAPLHWDRATIIHPRSLEMFESLGLVEPILAAGVKQHVARLHSAGSVVGEIDLSICGSRFPFNVGVSEEVTESILTEYLQQFGGQVVRSSRLVDLQQHDGKVLATIHRDGVTEQVSACWVVGCDGVSSATRKLSGIDLAGHDQTEAWAVFDATITDWSDSYEAIYAYLDIVPVILTSLPQRRWRVYLKPSSPDSDLLTDACSTLRPYLPSIHFDKITNPTRFHCHAKVATRYRSGRVLLAGDAAHVCSPSQGHGMNSGLQDAFNLAWKLALACRANGATALLDSYEAERRPVAERITASGEAFEQSQNLTDPNDRRARDETLRATFADPTTRRQEAIAEAELDIDYKGSPIVVGDHHAALSPGQRLPDSIPVRLDGSEARFLHEFAYRARHTAILIGGMGVSADRLTQIERSLHDQNGSVVETMFALSARSEEPIAGGRLSPDEAKHLGVDDVTLLVIRPDGHVGLRADQRHLDALTAYEALLTTGRA
jgi:2-polyprenyl-6-methoxyphenol hydroxylase-like FAD-dependent oxidoreductase